MCDETIRVLKNLRQMQQQVQLILTYKRDLMLLDDHINLQGILPKVSKMSDLRKAYRYKRLHNILT
jgi:hypothetical protein